MTRTGRVLFVGSYAPADRTGIRAFRFDHDTGDLTEIGGWSGITNPSFLTIRPGGERLYAVSETEAGRICAFAVTWSVDGAPELTPIGDAPSGGDHPCHVGLDPHGRWLAVSNYTSGVVSVIDLDDHGGLGPVHTSVELRGGSIDPHRQRSAHTHSATPTPDGRHVVVADLGGDRIVVFRIDPEQVVECGRAPVSPGAGPRHAVVRSPDRLVAVANELDSTVSTYRLDASGSLTHIATASTIPDRGCENLVAEVQLSADGRSLFVSNRGHDSIARFRLHDDGTLGERVLRTCAGHWPRHFAVLPGDRKLAIANERSHEVVVVPVPDGPVTTRIGMPSPTCVAVVPTDR